MDHKNEKSDELTSVQCTATDAKQLMQQRGERDGLAGLNPSSTSADYMKGYWEGRRVRSERNLRAS